MQMKIKSKLSLLAVASACALSVSASSPYYDTVTNFWYSGQQSNVLALANQRLAVNTNDIAGLLMKASWDMYHASVEEASNTLMRVRSVGTTVTSPRFARNFNFLSLRIICNLAYLARCKPSDREKDHSIGGRSGSFMPYHSELADLDRDGYFNNDAPAN